MDELKTAMNDHMDQMQEIVEKLSSELRIGLQPAMDNFIGFFHAIDWKVHLSTWIYSGQNYFDRHGVFLSVLWSGPLLVFSMIILVNTLFSLCQLIVKWKRAELRHRARLSTTKQD
ncbi:Transmembrane protein 18 [Cynara cardunculus var. scolymus]|uniref:Transmembrane protein 18 n=1 Tax=Cynara cardunculus var. scolymus TaxID=59895 RepID=A0A103XZZ0_CYNCS|nr:Transmembrane protein 18 [Cynara cardunculus var. scolymus]